MHVENKLAELDFDFSLLKLAEEEAGAVSKRLLAERSTEGAKSYLLLSRIAVARG